MRKPLSGERGTCQNQSHSSTKENMPGFHAKCGSLVTLSQNKLTAVRELPSQEFNHGVLFSSEPLVDDEIFEVRIDRKVQSWTGSLQLGITVVDPSTLDLVPSNALELTSSSWVLSGDHVFINGRVVVEEYETNLDDLREGDTVGVMRTHEGDLVFYVNSVGQGVAATNIPPTVYAIIDLYGKCVQVTAVPAKERHTQIQDSASLHESLVHEAAASSPIYLNRLRFHSRCGSMVKLLSSQRVAERKRPLDEFNNGVVLTNRPLRPDELFEIVIETLVDKWSGSIEVGITTHNPATLEFPSTMTNMRSGTIMMSGGGISTNGRGSRQDYGYCNLDELVEGSRIGLICTSSGELHFFVNGQDQGVAAINVPQPVWGVVDLYGRTVKVRLVDEEDREEAEIVSVAEDVPGDQLTFHQRCGSHAAVVNGGLTAHRPYANTDFNHGVALTARPLRPDEFFEVRLDKIVSKWAGSIEIGVTTHHPNELEFPATMTNIRSGTWMMTGNGVMHNGVTVLDYYGRSLDRLQVGDKVGLIRRSNGVLHFYVNGEDQGAAAGHIPEVVYGVVDLYGQASQVTIIDHSSSTPATDSSPYNSPVYPGGAEMNMMPLISPASLADSTYALPSSLSSSTLHRQPATPTVTYTDLLFHPLHGRNAAVHNGGLTASRPNALSEFNDAIVMTNRPLRRGEMFEVLIENLVDRWSGSLELGVTKICPEELDFPATMTDIDYETWMLSGSSVMQDGTIIRNGYLLDLDTLSENCRVGMLRHEDGSLHYYLDGEDRGQACTNVPEDVYAVIDLYGQCAQVSIVHRPIFAFRATAAGIASPEGSLLSSQTGTSLIAGVAGRSLHKLAERCGKSVTVGRCLRLAKRDGADFENGLVFSCSALGFEETFEFRVEELATQWAGSMAVGVCTVNPEELKEIPESIKLLEGETWYISGCQAYHSGSPLQTQVAHDLERLSASDVVGIRKVSDGTVRFFVNGQECCVLNVPGIGCKSYVVIDVSGTVQSVCVTSCCRPASSSLPESLASPAGPGGGVPLPLSLSQLAWRETMQGINAAFISTFGQGTNNRFHENHGRNVAVKFGGLSAQRTASYNQGVVFSKEPLSPGSVFQLKIEQLNGQWSGSFMLGITSQKPEKLSPPMSALALKKSTWLICGNTLYHAGSRVSNLTFDLDTLRVGQTAGVSITSDGNLHCFIDGFDQGRLAYVGSQTYHAMVDLYGQCEQVSCSTVKITNQVTEEKAALERSSTEKNSETQPDVRKCGYKEVCMKYIGLVGLPLAYFDLQRSCCCCSVCLQSPTMGIKAVDPSFKDWYRLALRPRRLNSSCENVNNEKWQPAFHATRVPVVRRILDEGQLLPPDLPAWKRSQMARSSKDCEGDSDGYQLLFSPSITLAASQSTASTFRDDKSNKTLEGQILVQVLVQPGSYKVRRLSSAGGSAAASEESSTTGQLQQTNEDNFVWYTKERGAANVQALLIRVQEM